MSGDKHTLGPYYYNPHSGKVWADTSKVEGYKGNDAVLCVVVNNHMPQSEAHLNGMRIAQCLNACNRMKSPVEEIKRLKKIEKLYNELITKNHE